MRILLASDLDKTLIFDNNISDENKDAVRRFEKSGGIFAISTGRPFNGVEQIIEELKVEPDYLILNNGALIINGKYEIVHRIHIDNDTVRKIVEEMSTSDIMVSVETGFTTYPIGLKNKRIDVDFISDIDGTFNNLKTVDEFDDIPCDDRENVAAVSLYIPNKEVSKVQEVCEHINKTYGQYVSAYRNTNFIDIVPSGCSKGAGVKWVSEKEDIDIGSVYVIGDSWNDDSMFEITEKSFTFTYAEEELKQKANYIVETVAECIDKYILK